MALSFSSSTQLSGTKISSTGAGFNKCSPDSIKFKSNRISSVAATTSTERPTSSYSSQYLSFNLSSSSPYQTSTLYQVLGISMNATCQEIKSAYRKLARVFHPDVIDDIDSKHTSGDQFMKIHDAYSTLSDPLRRADYDRELFTTRRRAPLCYTTTSSSSSSRPNSNWETDQCW